MDLTVRKENLTSGDQTWLGSEHGTSNGRSITLDVSAFTAGTHYPDGYIPSGTPLGEITATGLYGPYADAGAGGLGTVSGFLFTDVKVPADGADVQGVLLDHCIVIEDKLPFPVVAADLSSGIHLR